MHTHGGGIQALVIVFLVLGHHTRAVNPTPSPDHRAATAADGADSNTAVPRASHLDPASRRELMKAFEASLLNIFGLKSRPKLEGKVHIPQQMLDLYRRQMQKHTSEDTDIHASHSGISANTVRSFHHHADATVENDPNRIRYTFNAAALAEDEEVTGAELRLHREAVSEEDLLASLGDRPRKRPHHHRIDVHEVLRPASKSREAITRLLDTRVVDVRNSSWESFDVHPAVLKWKQFPHLNHGLEVHFTTPSGQSTSLQHVRLRRSTRTDEKRWQGKRPLLMTYSNDQKAIKAKRTRRNSRRRARRQKSRRKGKDECQRRKLYVDFSDVGWNDWIVAPPGYHAYYCHGECPFPLADYLNSTNHAIVQTLVHAVNRNAVPRACCVPTELSSISMLYLDEYGKVVLKKYQDMVVEGCGCR